MSVDIKHELKKLKPKIDQEMQKILPKKISNAWLNTALGKPVYKYHSETITEEVSKPIWDLLNRGGKRWRPALMIWCCTAVGGTEKKALPFTPIPEMVHNGTLVADDIEDGSEVRRGKPALHKLFGMDTAINDSNTLYFLPMIPVYRNLKKLSEKQQVQIYNVFVEEMLRVSLGQAMDIHWHKGKKTNLSEEHYLQMCLCKTGVLARMSAMIGGILGNGTKKQINALGEFAQSIGVGFQIQDDILNLVPESGEWGKTIGEDITEGKRTLLVLRALKKLNEKERKELIEILNSHTRFPNEIKRGIDLIQKTDAIEYAKGKAEEIVLGSWKKVDKELKESKAKQKLKALAEYSVQRKI
ncbi:MAG: polyprenyl synthetase family protein [Candidatus Diapherotrites archaeon]|nr:polyprenyl synthetase family protein [Candidatus Diapherotrites archaeon]